MYVTFDFARCGGFEMALYKIEDLSFKYPDQDREVLSHIDLEIEEGSFVTICGKSGCGKTTLLRQLKPILAPYGEKKGRIYFKEKPIEELGQRVQTEKLGYVLQNPEQQIVTDKVWHELAFGLESLGYDTPTIRLRVAEMASFFGITHWFHQSVHELSGGQKQLLNLASVMAMQPEVILLDEPTAQLDPIAAKNFIEMLRRVHEELGITIILSEHRLEEVLPLTNQLLVMEEGKILANGSVSEVGTVLAKSQNELFMAMPTAFKVAWSVGKHEEKQPEVITVSEGRRWLRKWVEKKATLEDKVIRDSGEGKGSQSDSLFKRTLIGHISKSKLDEGKQDKGNNTYESNKIQEGETKLLELKEVYFRYDKNSEDILKGVTHTFYKGKLHAIVGGNGTGKTTTLTVIGGLNKPYRGKVKWQEKKSKVVLLPQNPQDLFELPTVEEELREMLTSEQGEEAQLMRWIKELELEELLDKHPYDLSGGQMQSVALAKVLLLKPQVLLLDEPTKGLDEPLKRKLGELFKKLVKEGVTIIMVSHDLDFCARYSDECALFFDGNVISSGQSKSFFLGNSFYTTVANRLSRGIIEGCVTCEEVTEACRQVENEA